MRWLAEVNSRTARFDLLVGTDSTELRNAFELARRSYAYRSKMVHGERPADDLGKEVEQTRDLT